MNNKNMFIKIPNEYISPDSITHLNEKELFIYSILYMEKRLDGMVCTTMSVLSYFMNVRYSVQEVRNISSIKDSLNGLLEKGILKISSREQETLKLKSLRASDPIKISFIETNSKGHTQVTYDEIYKLNNMRDYYIFVAVKRWQNNKEGGVFNSDYNNFANILKVSRSTAIRSIEDALSRGVIYRNIGNYVINEQTIKQEKNQYKCTPFTSEEKTITTKKKDKEKYSPVSVYEELEGDFYYNDDALKESYNNWNRFEDECGEQFSPNSEEHLLVIEVENNTKLRKPTKMEARYMDKAKWRTKQMKKTNKGTEIWEKGRKEAEEEYSEKINNFNEDDIG